MTEGARHTYFSRGMLQIANYFHLQLGMSDSEIDGSIFLSAFSRLEDGKRVKQGPWEEGPCHGNTGDNNSKRLKIAEEWEELVCKRGRVIPNIAKQGDGRVVNIVRQGGLRSEKLKIPGKGRTTKDNGAKMICSFCGQQGLRGRKLGA
jgi:hypothetical protein